MGPRIRTLAVATAAAVAAVSLVWTGQGVAAAAEPNPPGLPPTVTQDPLPTVQIDGVVWGQVVVDNIVYVGGKFEKARPAGAAPGVSETPRSNLLAYDIRTGVLVDSFAPKVNGQVKALAASPDGKRLFVGGDFQNVDGQSRSRLAAIDLPTGKLVDKWQPAVGTTVNAVAATGSKVYFGGEFNKVNGKERKKLAVVNAADGTLDDAWTPKVFGARPVESMTLSPDRSRVIVGGRFNQIGETKTNAVASIDAATGQVLPFAMGKVTKNGEAPTNNTPQLDDDLASSGVWSLAAADKYIYGGGWSFAGDQKLGDLEGTWAADPTTGEVAWLNDCYGDTYGVAPVNGVLYASSHAHDCAAAGKFPEQNTNLHTQAWSTAPGSVRNVRDSRGNDFSSFLTSNLMQFAPRWTVGDYTALKQAVYSIAGNSEYVSMGGEFRGALDKKSQQGLVRFATHAKAPNAYGPSKEAPGTITAQRTTTGGKESVTAVLSNAMFDPDDTELTYDLVRNNDTAKPVASVTASTPGFWERGTGKPVTLTDPSPTGAADSYVIVARDGGGKTAATEKATVPARGGGATSPTPPVTNPGTTPDDGENLARAGTASMSSTFPGEPGIQHGADRAVDGNTGGDFRKGEVSHSDKGDGSVPAWWQVDLGQSRDIGKITVWNRTDCCSDRLKDFWVFVSDRPFDPNRTPEQRFDDGIAGFRVRQQPNPSASVTVAPSDGSVSSILLGRPLTGGGDIDAGAGRYVMVQLADPNQYLNLAEVQVYGPTKR